MQALLSGTSSFSGVDIANKRSHLVPQKTVSRAIWSSGIGTFRTSPAYLTMSVCEGKADIRLVRADFR
jgi:hypothetical protein